jgi:uncharacterized protein YPO0396
MATNRVMDRGGQALSMGLFPDSEEMSLKQLLPESPYVLTHLDVYNWGPFHNRHSAEIDPHGTAIIGPTGSGKTTLVDAFMTLLTALPKYNLASTGGHESDRDLISYVRGVAGAGNESGENTHIARPGKTVTAIGARFRRLTTTEESHSDSDGETINDSETINIAAIFWLDGTSSATADLKRSWIFSSTPGQDIDDWLAIHHEGGARALKQMGRTEPGLQVFDSKKAFLAQLRRFFDVGENAFTLLNRAAGLKQLNSIDEIFRELVLDDHSVFKRAAEVAAEFDDLVAIHEELEVARRQQQSLLPIEREYKAYQGYETRRQQYRQLQQCLPIWFAEHGFKLWQSQGEALDLTLHQCRTRCEQLQKALVSSEHNAQNLRDLYMQVGGSNVEHLRELIQHQAGVVATCQRYAGEYQLLTRQLQLDETLTSEALANNQDSVSTASQTLEAELQIASKQRIDHEAARQNLENNQVNLQQEFQAVKARPGSNIPRDYQDFRAALATELGLSEADLPFAAELLQIKPEQATWRGAIERAIGGHRLRLLIQPTAMRAALQWVNQRHNRLHVRLLDAKPPAKSISFLEDGFTRKLGFKDHPHREALKKMLAGIDRHCVDSADVLQYTPYGMTIQGLMSAKQGFFEKQDQKQIDQNWMTGFDNKDLLAELTQQLNDCDSLLQSTRQECAQAEQVCKSLQQRLDLLRQLSALRFDEIDLEGAKQKLAGYDQQMRLHQDPDSDAEQARLRWEKSAGEHKQQEKAAKVVEAEITRLTDKTEHAEKQKKRAFNRIGQGLTDEQRKLADTNFKTPVLKQLDDLNDIEGIATRKLQDNMIAASDDSAASKNKITRLMDRAQQTDTGALSEAGSELIDIEAYLDRLKVLTQEALPEKLQRFLEYLNQSSDQGVTQLLSNIDNEVAVIEERIADLNSTMHRVDFQQGHYLRLEPRRVVHESLRTLQAAQRHLRVAALENDEGESHYKALAKVIALLRDASDRKNTLGARALLDPRYRLQFFASVIERQTGGIISTFQGSQSGSGGEKEIIASYILMASLSYALCPDGASTPLFGTIVLDEAFSKSSQSVAGRIISALREFGLHPLFITPNKEMRLLRVHTRSAVLIHRRDLRATMTSLSWEELESYAEAQLEKLSSQRTPAP